MIISDILRYKTSSGGSDRPGLVTIAPGDTVADLVATLARHNVGALVVVDGDGGSVAGIASERDVVRRLADHGNDLLAQPVSSIMTTTVASCASTEGVDDVAGTMTERRIRHMPVIDDDRLVGIVSIGDVVSSRIRQLEHDRGQLEQYISS
ncbi:CBS domain-containing protein [uncultured Jatrophihabitans sp.]|uniref:CBS domain-containing protein n=1 Tax=uncultured Jatrophihabitans sp. TaxID=1610747 RepID=UPI0035CA6FF2